jgi:RNA polymerase sigma-70 factor (ECF subfamily)
MANESRHAEDFAHVAERVAGRLYRIGLRMCRSPEEAEDLVQDTLLQGFRKWGQFEGRSDPATWLYTIAGRLCQRRRRRRAGEPTRVESLSSLLPSSGDPILSLPAAGASPLDEHLRTIAEQTVSEALARLPPHVRLPLVLADIAELSTAEIARILGLKEATVKTRVHRARLRLRRALLEELPVRPAPPPDHGRQICLDLLQAKQDAMDRRAPFPFSSEELCARCQSLFSTLDLGREACASLGRGELPARLRALIQQYR